MLNLILIVIYLFEDAVVEVDDDMASATAQRFSSSRLVGCQDWREVENCFLRIFSLVFVTDCTKLSLSPVPDKGEVR